MIRKILMIGSILAIAVSMAAAADTPVAHAKLTAADIVAKNIAARGGLQTWRSVQTLSWAGKMGAGGNQREALPVTLKGKAAGGKLPVPPRPKDEVQLPFLMEMQRGRKVRFELQFNGQTAFQVYDGVNGWKVRPFLNRRDVEPFSSDELKIASLQSDIDGPLVDYVAKGTRVELSGIEKVDDRDNYKLQLTFKDGRSVHLWIDADTFLETKIEGAPRRLDGVEHPVEIYYSDYRPVSGLQVPFVLETRVLPLPNGAKGVRQVTVPAEKIVIEKVTVNPKFDASLFSKPQTETAANHAPADAANKTPATSAR
jgi:hypothetical protein